MSVSASVVVVVVSDSEPVVTSVSVLVVSVVVVVVVVSLGSVVVSVVVTVDLVDAITINKYLAGQITLSEQATKNADVNADGSLGDGDSTTLMQFVLMMIPNLPA